MFKFDVDFKKGEKNSENAFSFLDKIQKMLSVSYIFAFDVAPADSKYSKESACDRQSMFE